MGKLQQKKMVSDCGRFYPEVSGKDGDVCMENVMLISTFKNTGWGRWKL